MNTGRNPISISLPGYNRFGTVALAGQLAHFFFARMTPATRKEVDARRASVFPRSSKRACIGMHVRGGDACHAGRFCPHNLTATYFAQVRRSVTFTCTLVPPRSAIDSASVLAHV